MGLLSVICSGAFVRYLQWGFCPGPGFSNSAILWFKSYFSNRSTNDYSDPGDLNYDTTSQDFRPSNM